MIKATPGIIASQIINIVWDTDALAFISAASITDNIQKSAVNRLITDLKSYGLWTKMNAVYPFVGGTASSHKFNAKDPRDLDVAYRLVFSGGWTHDSNGITGNGTNSHADTKLNNSTDLSLNDVHFSLYNRRAGLTTETGLDMGCYDGTAMAVLYVNYTSVLKGRLNELDGSQVSVTDGKGLSVVSRTSSSSKFLSKNGTNTTFSSTSNAKQNLTIWIGSVNGLDQPTLNNYSFASIGSGLSTSDASNLYTIVQNYQTLLSRQV